MLQKTTYVPLPPKKSEVFDCPFKAPNYRANGRGFTEIRELFVRPGTVPSASGSAYVSIGKTRIACAVHGPQLATTKHTHYRGVLEIDAKATAFGKCEATSYADIQLQVQEALEGFVILERYPKAKIQVTFLIIEDDGGCLTACIQAASLALADAGIEMMDTVTAASAYSFALDDHSPQVFALDLDSSELAYFENKGLLNELHIALCPLRGGLAFVSAKGPNLTDEIFQQMLETAKAICEQIAIEIKKQLIQSHKKKSEKTEKRNENQ
eukprot:Platyproteum_vivax@DN2477_c0_g1_i1.p1